MMAGSTSVGGSDQFLRGQGTKFFLVHAEPGDDKITFANEIADWILARVGERTDQSLNSMENRSKL